MYIAQYRTLGEEISRKWITLASPGCRSSSVALRQGYLQLGDDAGVRLEKCIHIVSFKEFLIRGVGLPLKG